MFAVPGAAPYTQVSSTGPWSTEKHAVVSWSDKERDGRKFMGILPSYSNSRCPVNVTFCERSTGQKGLILRLALNTMATQGEEPCADGKKTVHVYLVYDSANISNIDVRSHANFVVPNSCIAHDPLQGAAQPVRVELILEDVPTPVGPSTLTRLASEDDRMAWRDFKSLSCARRLFLYLPGMSGLNRLEDLKERTEIGSGTPATAQELRLSCSGNEGLFGQAVNTTSEHDNPRSGLGAFPEGSDPLVRPNRPERKASSGLGDREEDSFHERTRTRKTLDSNLNREVVCQRESSTRDMGSRPSDISSETDTTPAASPYALSQAMSADLATGILHCGDDSATSATATKGVGSDGRKRYHHSKKSRPKSTSAQNQGETAAPCGEPPHHTEPTKSDSDTPSGAESTGTTVDLLAETDEILLLIGLSYPEKLGLEFSGKCFRLVREAAVAGDVSVWTRAARIWLRFARDWDGPWSP